jgi:Putative beta-barrel porin-2, OmpL-like. bbp2
MLKAFSVVLLLLFPLGLLAQQDSTPLVQFSGYVEAYYGYDFGNPPDHQRPSFDYSHHRHNEFNINLAYLKAAHSSAHTRANLALMTGTYPSVNLAHEPVLLRNILEANVGLRLSKTRDLWLDAGVMPAHIGFESAVSKDCWTLSRSLLADNSPYYEAGLKLGYATADQKWKLAGLVLNGWQRIRRPIGHQLPAFGHQVTYQPSAQLTLNSSSFVGSDNPDSTRQLRLFHNFYAIWQPSPQWGLTAGFDIGAQRAATPSEEFHTWHTAALILRRKFGERFYLAGRGEYYHDPQEVIIAGNGPGGFQTWGASLNLDYWVRDNVVVRVEGHHLRNRSAIFYDRGGQSRNALQVLGSLAVSF